MRWIVSMLLIAMLASTSAFVQAAGLTGKGIKAGVNFASWVGDDADWDGKKGRTGLAAGAFVEYSFSDVFAIQPEVLYSMKGAGTDDNGYEDSLKIDYIEIPLLLKLNIPTNGGVRPGFFLGPTLAFLVSADFEYSLSTGGTATSDAKDEYTAMDVGLTLGGGLAIPAGSGDITIDARYTFGFSTLDDSDLDIGDMDYKNSVFSIMAGYSF